MRASDSKAYRANTAMANEVMYVMYYGFRLLYPKRSGL